MESPQNDQQELGKLYIVSGPSGAGKTRLVSALVGSNPDIMVSVSYTTRPIRPGEQDGVDYHFVNDKEFRNMVDVGDLLEYAAVYDHYYGTSRAQLLKQLRRNSDVVLEIDWQGAQQVRKDMPNNVSIYLLPPSRETLEQRLRSRQQDVERVIQRRLHEAVGEISHYNEFDYVLINDDFDDTLADIQAIVRGNYQPPPGRAEKQESLIKDLLAQS